MVIAEVITGLGAIKTVLDSLKTAKDLGGGKASVPLHEVQAALIDAQRGLIAADQAHSADVDRIRALEKEVAAFQEWSANEKERYQLKQVANGAFAFALKEDRAAGEPPHWLCATCFQKAQKGFLQSQGHMPGMSLVLYKCSVCESSFGAPFGIHPRF